MIYTAGIDVGANYTKCVIMDQERHITGKAMMRSGFKFAAVAERALNEALENTDLKRDSIKYVAVTGYGRYMVPFRDAHITELTCHAKGAQYQFPNTRTVLDVGGQTIKAIKCDHAGKVKAFRLNDKCAAGTGAFLEKTARYMGYDTTDIGPLGLKSQDPVTVSSVCTVFAESEVINHLTSGTKPEDIMGGAILSLAGRAVQLMKRVRQEPEYTVVGGMSRLDAFRGAIEKSLGAPVNILDGEMGQYNGAFGAALLAHSRLEKLETQAAS